MTTPRAPLWPVCLCVLLSLSGCGLWQTRPTVLTRPEIVTVPVPAYRPLPHELTDPLSPPPPPPRRCALDTVCVLDALAWIEDWRALLKAANADRARAALLGAGDGTQ